MLNLRLWDLHSTLLPCSVVPSHSDTGRFPQLGRRFHAKRRDEARIPDAVRFSSTSASASNVFVGRASQLLPTAAGRQASKPCRRAMIWSCPRLARRRPPDDGRAPFIDFVVAGWRALALTGFQNILRSPIDDDDDDDRTSGACRPLPILPCPHPDDTHTHRNVFLG